MSNLTHRGRAMHLRPHRPIRIIHVNIQSGRNKSTDHQTTLRNDRNSTDNTKNESIRIRRIPPRHPSLSQSHGHMIKTNCLTTNGRKQQSLPIAINSGQRSPKLSQVAHYETRDVWSKQPENILDHHRKRKKKCSNRGVKILIVITAILLIIAITTILLVLFIKRSKVTTPVAILRWNTTGITIAGITGSPGNGSNQLRTPFGARLDYQNTLYIADTYNYRIQKYLKDALNGTTVAGNANGLRGNGSNELYGPSKVLIASNGNMFVADSWNHRIMLWSNGATSGVVVAGITGIHNSNTNNTLYSPYGIDYDLPSNSLYISDYSNARVMRYSVGASSGSIVAGTGVPGNSTTRLEHPVGLYFDSLSSSLIIANHFAHNIVRWPLGATNWSLLAGNISGNAGNGTTALDLPTDVTLDPMGNIYVADRDNHRIQLFISGQLEGITIAGVTGIRGNSSTLFNKPWSVALDGQLNLYVAGANNHRIQKFLRY